MFQNEEARIAREIEAHENRIRKALEKENILRRKVGFIIKEQFEGLLKRAILISCLLFV